VRCNVNGSVDSTFGTAGIVTNIFGDDAFAVATVGDKIVVGGQGHIKKYSSVFALARFNSDGSLDQTFGSGGTVLTDFANGGEYALEMAVQTDGKIVLSGLHLTHTGKSSLWEFAVARYTPNGVLDTTFGSGGEVIVDVGESLRPDSRSGSRYMDMALSGDHIDLVGSGSISGSMYVVQLTAAGQLDPSFGVGGMVKGATC